VRGRLLTKGIRTNELNMLLIALKEEAQLELWVKKKDAKFYGRLKTFGICSSSGGPGPKRQAGDGQVPEGFYHINRFNPSSNFYLSLGIDYPNRSDRILCGNGKAGGDIFIHGSCVTIGCMPLTDEGIKELYVYAVEASNNGQNIPVYIFPCRMDPERFVKLSKAYAGNTRLMHFWKNLKEGYRLFLESPQELKVRVDEKGNYLFN
jgi:murein L,D-transpeptidase YafK